MFPLPVRPHRGLLPLWLVLPLVFPGCQPAGQAQGQPVAATAPVVLTAAQTQLYAQSCKNCHENPATPAPQAHNTTQWQPRLQQGIDTLLMHTVAGFNQMPAGGLCTTCTAEDFKALIGFMSQPHLSAAP